MNDSWDAPQIARRRWPLAAGLLVAVLAAGVVARVGVGPTGGSTLPVERGSSAAPAVTTPSPALTPEPAGGEWVELDAAPIDLPAVHVGAWTGSELLVGFHPAVAGYNPAEGRWRHVPDVPEPRRIDPAVVWTGQEILLVGGTAPDAADPHRSDGLRLDPNDEGWEPIPPAPAAPLWDPTAVWTGTELIVWGGARPGDAHRRGDWPVHGSAYRPDLDRWRTLPPAPVEGVYFSDGLWTGREIIFWGTHHPPGVQLRDEAGPSFAAAYDPTGDTWRRLPDPPLHNPAEAAAVWTGRTVILWGQPAGSPQDETGVIGAALDVHVDDDRFWHLLPPVDAVGDPPTFTYGLVAAWTGDHAILYGGYPRSVGLAYHPDRKRPWQQLPAHRARVNAVTAWTGSELLLWGGYTTTGPDVDLWAYCPTASTATPCRTEQATTAGPRSAPLGTTFVRAEDKETN